MVKVKVVRKSWFITKDCDDSYINQSIEVPSGVQLIDWLSFTSILKSTVSNLAWQVVVFLAVFE